jgi:hypothetical protein
MSRLTNTLATTSAIMCAIALVILPASYCLEGRPLAVALTSSLKIAILNGNMDFRNQWPGELFVRSLGGGETDRYSDWTVLGYGMRQMDTTDARGNFILRNRYLLLPGICFGHHKRGQAPAFWELTVSLWYPVLVLAGLPAVSIFRWWRAGGSTKRGAGGGGLGPHWSSGATGPAAPGEPHLPGKAFDASAIAPRIRQVRQDPLQVVQARGHPSPDRTRLLAAARRIIAGLPFFGRDRSEHEMHNRNA